MNQERIYKVLLGPVISEKAASASEAGNHVVFKVVADASKTEIKAAVEQLFEVKVEDVRTLNVKGKTKRTRHGMGKRSDWKKAYVRLVEGQDIDLQVAE
ncbi:50S ribosomal protein L23 [Marinibactrum halimedae]|uniref:Large ribosomal subunit protein uL23 n=1 Tax=Marinibactrum halimedae TaxID=1444977 RepID=A0AA37T2P0_9GAMM|nr:50S ribosomal protein L23 [Marinibactrum halimedae]MCD9459280.1 50S ribosomal protein L23 [Marinibactrum halimedae]GLS25829.1 50S ribosomal protein L23 [Marinibactrum halimedae]